MPDVPEVFNYEQLSSKTLHLIFRPHMGRRITDRRFQTLSEAIAAARIADDSFDVPYVINPISAYVTACEITPARALSYYERNKFVSMLGALLFRRNYFLHPDPCCCDVAKTIVYTLEDHSGTLQACFRTFMPHVKLDESVLRHLLEAIAKTAPEHFNFEYQHAVAGNPQYEPGSDAYLQVDFQTGNDAGLDDLRVYLRFVAMTLAEHDRILLPRAPRP